MLYIVSSRAFLLLTSHTQNEIILLIVPHYKTMPYAKPSPQPNKRFLKKIPKGSEVANIMVGSVDFLYNPITIFVRLAEATKLADLTEVDLPTRFLVVILGPGEFSELGEQGRAAGSLFSDKVCLYTYPIP